MNCPTCDWFKHLVIRTEDLQGDIERTRQCCSCGFRWKTVELKHADYARAVEALDLAAKLQRLAPGG
jgi:transcriptional regulator NrdR family protein